MSTRWVDVGESVAKAASVAAWVAVPDYASTKGGRAALKSGLIIAVMAAVIAAERLRGEQPGAEGRQDTEDEPTLLDRVGTARAALLVGAGLGGSAASTLLVSRGSRKAAGWLEGRGVRRPWTAVGVVAGALTLAGDFDTLRTAVRGQEPTAPGPAPA